MSKAWERCLCRRKSTFGASWYKAISIRTEPQNSNIWIAYWILSWWAFTWISVLIYSSSVSIKDWSSLRVDLFLMRSLIWLDVVLIALMYRLVCSLVKLRIQTSPFISVLCTIVRPLSYRSYLLCWYRRQSRSRCRQTHWKWVWERGSGGRRDWVGWRR